MPRHNRRKTTRWINEDCMQSAVRDICEGIETPSTAARKYGLKRTTIIYRVEKKQKMDLVNGTIIKDEVQPVATPARQVEIFSAAQENELMAYLNRYTYLPYDTSGSYKAARQLVYQFVKEHNIFHPKLWDIEQQAGMDWLEGFIQRNPGTNLRNTAKTAANDKKNNGSLHCNDNKLSIKKINLKTESSAQPALELSRINSNHLAPALSEQSLESNNSFANSCQSYVESSSVANNHPLNSCDPDGMNEDSSQLDLEPECHITMVSIKDEPIDGPSDECLENDMFAFSGGNDDASKANSFPNLDTVPENDDVFNSFGRNIAFQAKELFQHNQIDALELMHEVQTLVNRRLTSMLRLNKANGRKKPAKRLRRLLENDNNK